MSYLLDTNVLSEARKRRRNPGVAKWFSEVSSDRLHLSVLTLGEIERGITNLLTRGDQRQAMILTYWLDSTVTEYADRIIPVTPQVAIEWGRQSIGQPIPAADALIAATAAVYGLTLVSRNVKDFKNTGVRVFNPFSD